MNDVFVGSEALAAGLLTPYELRSRYMSLHKDVYVPKDAELTPVLRARACWLRSRRRGILAGFSASALHGSKWIDAAQPAAIIDTNRRLEAGVQIWEEHIEGDEIAVVNDMRVTTPARTALDLTRRYPLGAAVAAVDALVQATELKMADVEVLVDRYKGRRGMKAARAALDLVDGGAQSPKEIWLRLLLIQAGFPRPQTQIPIRNEWVGPKRIWIWAGRTSRLPRSMRVISTKPVATTIGRISAVLRKWSATTAGSWFASLQKITPPISSAG